MQGMRTRTNGNTEARQSSGGPAWLLGVCFGFRYVLYCPTLAFWHDTIVPHAFFIAIVLSNSTPTDTTIAVGTLGWTYTGTVDFFNPVIPTDPGGAAVYEYNEASDIWDIVCSYLPTTIENGNGGQHVILSGDGNYDRGGILRRRLPPCMSWRMAIGYQRPTFQLPPPLRPRLSPSLP
jgi:hypothetical protein